ncbi:WHG domain-containing protein [Spiractinospora alimapuensis]|uniref:TetR-like C-terminal domain-containing protein n=1 Tax=Spiractinospora alimapuensis TaxID=2820884 RepID=UPI001F33E7F6|nr:TetR-like C-terminal domain-containing protein [Spiractinospora alimapuensis]QVQ54524.1 WHG domain-containing protein [Spiractinospora alimapuensis]
MTTEWVADTLPSVWNTPYKHFEDKRDLLATVAAGELRRLAESVAAPAGAGAARLESAALRYLDWASAHPARFKLTFGSWTGPHEELAAAAARATGAMEEVVRQAQREHTSLSRDTARVLSLIWATAHGAMDLELGGHLRKRPESPSKEELVTSLVAMLRGGAGASPEV